jgi:hypothetical protein
VDVIKLTGYNKVLTFSKVVARPCCQPPPARFTATKLLAGEKKFCDEKSSAYTATNKLELSR